MYDITKIPLISSEIAGIWASYAEDSLGVCILKYFLAKSEDEDIKSVLQHALNLSAGHISTLTNLFNAENIPVPEGFTDDDVNTNAPPLFADSYSLFYLSFMTQIGLKGYSMTLNHIARRDLRDYYTSCISESTDLFNRIADVLLDKGLYIRAPRVEIPRTVEFMKKEGFFANWFKDEKLLTLRDVTYIFSYMLACIIKRSLLTGFGQVSETKKVSEYMFRGKDLMTKHIGTFATLLNDEGVPIPATSESFTRDSTAAPFTKKLMMYQSILLCSAAMADCGAAASMVYRNDIRLSFIKASSEIGKYAEDGLDILLANGWLEKPPHLLKSELLRKN